MHYVTYIYMHYVINIYMHYMTNIYMHYMTNIYMHKHILALYDKHIYMHYIYIVMRMIVNVIRTALTKLLLIEYDKHIHALVRSEYCLRTWSEFNVLVNCKSFTLSHITTQTNLLFHVS